MFCFQCEQTLHGTGCVDTGVCGKDPTTAALQDLLVHAVKGISMYADRAHKYGFVCDEIDLFVIESLFTTVTNVNFHPSRLEKMLRRAANLRDQARTQYEKAAVAAGDTPEKLSGPAGWIPDFELDGLVLQGIGVSVRKRLARLGADVSGMQELIIYGLKGAAAYFDHAVRLGKTDPALYAEFHAGLNFLTREDATMEELAGWAMRVGQLNYKVMALLDEANTGAYGKPTPTRVRTEPIRGKAILVSGHDLRDLEELLKQTEGKGINVYTHGEMLPAHGYPKLKSYSHLVGNYGGPWMLQAEEFDSFPGAILMTTNCIQKPREAYIERIFTSGLVAWPGVRHIANGDYSAVIEAALEAPGFADDGPDSAVTVGFGHDAVLGVADKVIAGVKSGAIKHFFLIGGCDGAKTGRNYFTELALAAPADSILLTLGCGKYRFNKMEFGEIGGLPRLLDMGQCNDAYSAIQVALALSQAFDCGVNELPLSLVLSWYEQKAVAVLLTLLSLGVKNIRIGPSLPAFVTPTMLQFLSDTFSLKPIGNVEEDLKNMLAPA